MKTTKPPNPLFFPISLFFQQDCSSGWIHPFWRTLGSVMCRSAAGQGLPTAFHMLTCGVTAEFVFQYHTEDNVCFESH